MRRIKTLKTLLFITSIGLLIALKIPILLIPTTIIFVILGVCLFQSYIRIEYPDPPTKINRSKPKSKGKKIFINEYGEIFEERR